MISSVFRVATGILLAQSVCWGEQGLCVRDLPVPNYSRLARMARLQGTVVVEVEISVDGKVVKERASGGHALLQREARANARQWTFRNVPLNSKFPVKHSITYVYRLEGESRYEDPPPVVKLTLPDRVEITSHPPTVEPSTGGASGLT